ncbi:conserved hypothetical protein, partial [methanotrophic bacterial endosymbiont of Bathymodiolus sp.]
ESMGRAHFEYEPEFINSGIEVAPLTMPLSKQIYSFPALSRETFHGLPGLLADLSTHQMLQHLMSKTLNLHKVKTL